MDAKFVLKIFTVLFNNAEFLSFGSFSFFACETKKENEHKKFFILLHFFSFELRSKRKETKQRKENRRYQNKQ